MKLGTFFAAGLLAVTAGTAVLAVGGLALPGATGAAFAQSTAPASTAEAAASADATSQRLDAAAVIALIGGRGFTDIREIEREGDGWEVKATSPDGDPVEIYLNAAGEITKTERE